MKQVLIIGSDFVPSSLPPATRIRLFARHLAEFGWKPIVLTARPEFYECPIDNDNERLLPTSVEVIRTKALPVRWTRRLGVRDIGLRTLWHHWQAIKNLCGQRKIDLVFIPVPPSVAMVLGRMTKRRFGIPYVIDYIDPWVTDAYKTGPRHQKTLKRYLADLLARLLEPIALKGVAHLTGVSQGTTDSVIARYRWLSREMATEVPYGAEPDDFEYLRQNPRRHNIFNPADGFIHLSCVGACIPAMHPAVRALFAAFKLGLERAPREFVNARLHFVGTSYDSKGEAPLNIVQLAREAGIERYVDERAARIPYLESLQVMLDSAGLFLVGSEEPHYTASKVFPYILAQRPLLAIFREESSVVDILSEVNLGEVVTFNGDRSASDRIEEIQACLARVISQVTNREPRKLNDSFEHYTSRSMARRLATVFDGAGRQSLEVRSPQLKLSESNHAGT